MRDRVKEIWIEFMTSCSDTMLNYRLSQKLKLLGYGKFNQLTTYFQQSSSLLAYHTRVKYKIDFCNENNLVEVDLSELVVLHHGTGSSDTKGCALSLHIN